MRLNYDVCQAVQALIKPTLLAGILTQGEWETLIRTAWDGLAFRVEPSPETEIEDGTIIVEMVIIPAHLDLWRSKLDGRTFPIPDYNATARFRLLAREPAVIL